MPAPAAEIFSVSLSDGVAKKLEARLDEGSVTATVILDARMSILIRYRVTGA